MKKIITIFILFITLSLPCSSSNIAAKDYCDSGLKNFELGNYNSSIEDFTKAIQLEPQNYDAYVLRGNTKRSLKDYDGSIKDYTKAIELDPNSYKGYLNRGISKYELKDYNGSIDDCTKAIKLNSNCEWAYFYRGKSKNVLKDYYGSAEDNKKYEKLTEYFNTYIKKMTQIIKSNWDPPIKTPKTNTIARYTLNKKGEISNIKIVKSSGILQNDESAIKALKISSPLPPLPVEFQGTSVDIEFHFDINPVW